MFADFHLHSIYSDGTDKPDELISLAFNHDISVISIADHDSITAYSNIAISGGTDWHGRNNGAEVTHFGMCGLENDIYPILSISFITFDN